jgi:hypothetical protein
MLLSNRREKWIEEGKPASAMAKAMDHTGRDHDGDEV